jgi:hypothetical protein
MNLISHVIIFPVIEANPVTNEMTQRKISASRIRLDKGTAIKFVSMNRFGNW